MCYNKRQVVTLEQAVTEAIDSFVSLNKSFSAHEVTGAVRNTVNQGDLEISGVPYGYVDANNTHSQMITHADVRSIVQQIAETRNYDVNYNSGYRIYTVPAAVATSATNSSNPYEVVGTVEFRVATQLSDMLGVDLKRIANSTHLVDDLGSDDLDMVELEMAIEEEFKLTNLTEGCISDQCKTVEDVVKTVNNALSNVSSGTVTSAPANAVAVPARFTVGVKDDQKKKITATARRYLNNGWSPCLRVIQKNSGVRGVTVEDIQNILSAEGYKIDTTSSTRSLFTVSK